MTASSVTSSNVGPAVPDVLGEGYQAMTIELPDDGPEQVRATLVRRRAGAPTERAVLYVHGYVDYFFQTELADFHTARGSDFYALDLRRYGRSLLPGQEAYLMHDVSDYFPELDAALAHIESEGHTAVTIVAHSTGGLIVPLWLADRHSLGPIDSIVLNSPFLEINAPSLVRYTVGTGVDVASRWYPGTALPLGDLGLYGRSIHSSRDGEWSFDTTMKPLTGVPLRIGWLAAIRRAHARLRHNLGLTCPILVLASTRTVRLRKWSSDMFTGDAVLNADRIAELGPRLGKHVTVVRIENGMHDLFLSREAPRRETYVAVGDWLDRYDR